MARFHVLRGPARTLGCIMAFASPALGQEPVSITTRYSPYEEQAIHDAETALETHVDPAPEGKRIERIEFMRLEPLDPHDPAPMILNVVHVTSKPVVIRHELLVRRPPPDGARSVRAPAALLFARRELPGAAIRPAISFGLVRRERNR